MFSGLFVKEFTHADTHTHSRGHLAVKYVKAAFGLKKNQDVNFDAAVPV